MSKYYDEQKIKQTDKLNSMLVELPSFCTQFFVGIEQTMQPSTRLSYAYNLKLFFNYIHTIYPDEPMTVEILNIISAYDIEQFLSYIKNYTNADGKEVINGKASIKCKVAAIKSLYTYFYRHQEIKFNTAEFIDLPEIEAKNIVRLNDIQIDNILDNIENRTHFNYQSSELYIKRDYAVIALLLGTGIRVSECSGIDVSDISFMDCSVNIVRKGGNEDVVFFSDEIRDCLIAYYNLRRDIVTDEKAFFLSTRKTRLSVRSIQNLVTKYTKDIKKVSPHKLRATYGTNLYIATKDIYLVSDTLGHRNVETTRRHYADIPSERKKEARNYIHLRKLPVRH